MNREIKRVSTIVLGMFLALLVSTSILQVFFLPNDEIEVWATRYDLGHPDHPSKRDYPKNPNPVPQES